MCRNKKQMGQIEPQVHSANLKIYYTFLIFCILSFNEVVNGRTGPIRPSKLIIDTDAGADDAVAILMIIESEMLDNDGLEVLAITCVAGNTKLKNVEQNVLKILTTLGRDDIPVYAGADRPILVKSRSDVFFGSDGFGDFEFQLPIQGKVDETTHAAVAIIQLIKKYPGEVSILSIGPLTNIALAMRLDPTLVNNVKQIYIMGSCVRGLGNFKPNVEFNFGTDPEANFIVLNSTVTPAVILPWETTYDTNIAIKWRMKVLGSLNSPAVQLINQAERISLEKQKLWISADSMAAAVTLWPQIITQSELVNVNPLTDGLGRGSVTVDYNNLTSNPKNALIILSFDKNAYKNKLLKYLGRKTNINSPTDGLARESVTVPSMNLTSNAKNAVVVLPFVENAYEKKLLKYFGRKKRVTNL